MNKCLISLSTILDRFISV